MLLNSVKWLCDIVSSWGQILWSGDVITLISGRETQFWTIYDVIRHMFCGICNVFALMFPLTYCKLFILSKHSCVIFPFQMPVAWRRGIVVAGLAPNLRTWVQSVAGAAQLGPHFILFHMCTFTLYCDPWLSLRHCQCENDLKLFVYQNSRCFIFTWNTVAGNMKLGITR